MRGLGRHTKPSSRFIIGGVIGGSCVRPLTGMAADRYSTGMAMVVPLAFFVAPPDVVGEVGKVIRLAYLRHDVLKTALNKG